MKNLLLALIATILVFGSCSKTKNGRDGYVRMKHLTILFLFVLVFFIGSSCKKDKSNDQPSYTGVNYIGSDSLSEARYGLSAQISRTLIKTKLLSAQKLKNSETKISLTIWPQEHIC
jgi:hypothetical protein